MGSIKKPEVGSPPNRALPTGPHWSYHLLNAQNPLSSNFHQTSSPTCNIFNWIWAQMQTFMFIQFSSGFFAFVLLFPNCHTHIVLITSDIHCTVCLFYHGLRYRRSFLTSSSDIFTAKPFWGMPNPWLTACIWSIIKHYNSPYVPPSHRVGLCRTAHTCILIDWL